MTASRTEERPHRNQRRHTWRRRIVRVLLALIVVSPLIGWAYEQYAVRRNAKRFPPPGQFVHVERLRRVHYVCSGSGSPLVLFEVSGFSNAMSFREARAGLSQHTRVCSYDRMGIGWSDRGPSRIPVSMLADDLRALLDELSPRTPVILVASSIGGLTVEFFARQHPERIAGLVFLDAANSEAVHRRLANQTLTLLASGGCSLIRAAGDRSDPAPGSVAHEARGGRTRGSADVWSEAVEDVVRDDERA